MRHALERERPRERGSWDVLVFFFGFVWRDSGSGVPRLFFFLCLSRILRRGAGRAARASERGTAEKKREMLNDREPMGRGGGEAATGLQGSKTRLARDREVAADKHEKADGRGAMGRGGGRGGGEVTSREQTLGAKPRVRPRGEQADHRHHARSLP